MLKKMLIKLEQKLGIDMNENVLAVFITIVAAILVVGAVFFGDVQWVNILNMGAGIFMQVAIFMSVMLLFEMFMVGIGYDIISEIKKGNLAMAINMASWRLALALVIAKGIL